MTRMVRSELLAAVILLGAIDTWAAPPFGPPILLSTDAATGVAGDDEKVSVAGDGRGTSVAVWRSEDGPHGSDFDILVSRSGDAGASWDAPRPLNPDAADPGSGFHENEPRVAADGSGNWVAVWGKQSQPQASRSTDGGVTWSDPVAISTQTGDPTALAAAPGGVFALLFGGAVTVSRDGGQTWSAPVDAPASASTIAVAGDSIVVLTLTASGQLLAYRSTDGGATWGPPAVLDPATPETDPDFARTPTIAADTTGTFVAAWANHAAPGDEIYLARSTDRGVTWSPREPLSTSGGSDGSSPHLATDASGRWLLAFRARPSTFDYGIGTALSTDGGVTWTPPALIASGDHPVAAAVGANAWVVGWETDAFGGDDDVAAAGGGGDESPAASTTTTTLPPSTGGVGCANARCLLFTDGLGAPACAGQRIPGTLLRRFQRIVKLLDVADAAPKKVARPRRKARSLLRLATLGQLRVLAKRRNPGRECVSAIERAVLAALERIESLCGSCEPVATPTTTTTLPEPAPSSSLTSATVATPSTSSSTMTSTIPACGRRGGTCGGSCPSGRTCTTVTIGPPGPGGLLSCVCQSFTP